MLSSKALNLARLAMIILVDGTVARTGFSSSFTFTSISSGFSSTFSSSFSSGFSSTFSSDAFSTPTTPGLNSKARRVFSTLRLTGSTFSASSCSIATRSFFFSTAAFAFSALNVATVLSITATTVFRSAYPAGSIDRSSYTTVFMMSFIPTLTSTPAARIALISASCTGCTYTHSTFSSSGAAMTGGRRVSFLPFSAVAPSFNTKLPIGFLSNDWNTTVRSGVSLEQGVSVNSPQVPMGPKPEQ